MKGGSCCSAASGKWFTADPEKRIWEAPLQAQRWSQRQKEVLESRGCTTVHNTPLVVHFNGWLKLLIDALLSNQREEVGAAQAPSLRLTPRFAKHRSIC